MVTFPEDRSRLRILISNDDGIHAPGIRVLEEIARQLTDDVWVVAPETEQSAMSHALTVRRPLKIRQFDDRHFCVDGTPTDSVVIALRKILIDQAPDLVLSGINHGGNQGEDVVYSGTVAAAMEAVLLGTPAIACSQVRRGEEPVNFDVPKARGAEVVNKLLNMEWERDMLVNVNFPPCKPEDLDGIAVGRQGVRVGQVNIDEGHDPRGAPYVWIGDFASNKPTDENSDLAQVRRKRIAVTPLRVDLTHDAMMDKLSEALA